MPVKRTNPKGLQTINLKVQALAKVQGKVGWFESAKYENGTPVAYVAAIQELGYPGGNIPPRPFMRPTAIAHEQEWRDIAAQGARAVIKGEISPDRFMEQIVMKAEGDVAQTISEVNSPPLSPITIELRAMKKRDPELTVTGATVGQAARKVAEPGYQTPNNVSVKPLNDTGHMIATLSHAVEKV